MRTDGTTVIMNQFFWSRNMQEIITKIDGKTGTPVVEKRAALAGFLFRDGYKFLATDLGKQGVKIELSHKDEDSAA